MSLPSPAWGQPRQTELDRLFSDRALIEASIAECKARLAETNQAIATRFHDQIANAYQREGKQGGVVRISLDGKSYRVDTDKTVKWDSDECQRIAGSIPFEVAVEVFKIEYSVTETIFKAVDDELRAKLMKARTVKYHEPKITQAG